MAAGDVTWLDQALLDLGKKEHDLSADTIKLGLMTDGITPTAADANPCWGAGGGTNYSTYAVATGTAYTGPITLTGGSWTIVGGVPSYDSTLNPSIAQDAGGFTNARWAAIYNDTNANKKVLGFLDLGSNRSIVTGPLDITWGTAIFTLDQA